MVSLGRLRVWIGAGLAALPFAAIFLWVGITERQRQLDMGLLAALERSDVGSTVALLDQGANANAMKLLNPPPPPTFGSQIAEFIDAIKGRRASWPRIVRPSILIPFTPPSPN